MLHRQNNVLREKSDLFTDRIILMMKFLDGKKVPSFIKTQVGKSGTSIGANVAESINAQSRADFVSKLTIALKEANETDFWFRKLLTGDYLTQKQYDSISADLREIIALLTAIIKTTKQNGL